MARINFCNYSGVAERGHLQQAMKNEGTEYRFLFIVTRPTEPPGG
jgi:hypothetical protein